VSKHGSIRNPGQLIYNLPHNLKVILVPRLFIKRKESLKSLKVRNSVGLDGVIYSRRRAIYISHELNPELRLRFLEESLPELLKKLRYSKASREKYYKELESCLEYTNLVDLLATRRFK